jgi:alkyl sulfatase BDS1-like metallo-beta-lactamase superfamily hydrolase
MDRDAALSVDSLILSFRTMFDPHASEGFRASYELRFGDEVFHALVKDGLIEIARGSADRPDATIESDPGTLAALVYDGRDLAEATRSADLTVRGDQAAVERFLTLFTLPKPAPSS